MVTIVELRSMSDHRVVKHDEYAVFMRNIVIQFGKMGTSGASAVISSTSSIL
jgi:hypothetical protein